MASTGLGIVLAGLIFAMNGSPAASSPRSHAESTPGARAEEAFGAGIAVDLPAATTAASPTPASLAAEPNLRPHEVFGFAPYWSLSQEAGYDFSELTTISYFSLDVGPDGSVATSGPGWVGYESQALVDLVDAAHAASDRVVLTLSCFDQHALDSLSSDPLAANRLAGQLEPLLKAKSLDGVNLDFEGNGSADRAGLDAFVSQLGSDLRPTDPHWQITMDTYASSAGDPSGFFDVAGLAPSVDGFFVMAYDMDDPSQPSPTAPLTGASHDDTVSLEQYEQVVPASKIVLGIPDYGYQWQTSGPGLGSPSSGPPTAVTYAQVLSTQSPTYWDAATETPWTAYETAGQWHQVFFDNPVSIALKAHLAAALHTAGVGLWALGMDGGDPAVMSALVGSAAPARYSTGPLGARTGTQGSSAPGSASPATGGGAPSAAGPGSAPAYAYGGSFEDHEVTLEAVNPATLPGGGQGTSAGELTGFSTNDPSKSCLEHGPALAVTELEADPTRYLVSASTPGDCTSGDWTFTEVPAGGTPSTTTTTSPLQILPGGLGGSSSGSAASGPLG